MLDLNTETYNQVEVDVVTDQATLKPRQENASSMIRYVTVSPKGKRAMFEARGDIFSVPAEHGVVRNLTRTSGVAERYPSWSPDGKYVACWSGSGGDAFPDYFRKAGLGPLIGTRTWGGLIGITGVPGLIDGGMITVPTFRMYNPDGTWFKEGHGVDPDIEVLENPTLLAKGVDTQLDKAIEVLLNELETNPPVKPERPPYEDRSGK